MMELYCPLDEFYGVRYLEDNEYRDSKITSRNVLRLINKYWEIELGIYED